MVTEDAAVELGTDSCITLVVHNHTFEMAHLPAGHVIGWLQSAVLLPIPDTARRGLATDHHSGWCGETANQRLHPRYPDEEGDLIPRA